MLKFKSTQMLMFSAVQLTNVTIRNSNTAVGKWYNNEMGYHGNQTKGKNFHCRKRVN